MKVILIWNECCGQKVSFIKEGDESFNMEKKSGRLKRIIPGVAGMLGVLALILYGKVYGEKQDIKEFTAFFAVSGTAVDDDNVVKEKIAEITKARCHEKWLSGETAEQAVTRMIAGEEYPDFVNADKQLLEVGALIPIDEYWDAYPNIKNLLSESQWERFRQDDGHIYWIPQFGITNGNYSGVIHADEAFWIQTRVLKWAGYPRVKTLEEYFDLLERYMKANPVMEDGTPNIAYTILCDDWRYFCLENPPQFLDGYPNDGSVMVNPDTLEVIDYNTTPTARKYFQKLNEEYQKGIIDPESFTQTYEEYITKLSTGRVLGMVDQWWQFAYNISDYLKQPELIGQGCNYVPLPITISEGVKNRWHTMSNGMLNISDGLAITTGCEDVEGAMQFVNDLLSQEVETLRYWGIEGEDYEVSEDGVFYITPEQRKRAEDPSYQTAQRCSYSYFPHHEGMSQDGINAYTPEMQPEEFRDSLPKDVKECLEAYGCRNYVEMLGANPAPGPWFPMYSHSEQLTTASDAGEVFERMTKVKQEILPKVVMSENFEQAWSEYQEQYQMCRPEIFLEEMQREVERRVGGT